MNCEWLRGQKIVRPDVKPVRSRWVVPALVLGLGAALLLATSCSAEQPKPKRIEYTNGVGARVVSEGNKMTVSTEHLGVTVDCSGGQIDLSTQPYNLDPDKNYWLAISTYHGNKERRDFIATGKGNGGATISLHGTHHSIRGTNGPEKFFAGEPVDVVIYQADYTEGYPDLRQLVGMTSVLTPDRCQ